MRTLLLLSVALVPLLLRPASAEVAENWGDQQPVSETARPSRIKPPAAKRAVVKSASAKQRAAPKPVAAATPPPVVKDLVIDSMDLNQIERSVGSFSIQIIPPAAVPASVPALGPAVAITDSPTGDTAATGIVPATQRQTQDAAQVVTAPRLAAGLEPVAGAEPAILLRTDPDVGAAAFRLGTDVVIVLDTPLPIQVGGTDLDPVFAGLTSRQTREATLVRMPMPAAGFRLARTPRGWLVSAGPPVDAVANVQPRLIQGGAGASVIRLVTTEPSRVVTVLNPDTGSRLLVGTVGTAGQAVPTAWSQTRFSFLPTLQGVVVAPLSDDIRLRREPDGFVLTTDQQPEGVADRSVKAQPELPIQVAPTRLFSFPTGSVKDLLGTLSDRIQAAGRAHVLARSAPRLQVAEAMLSLGMDVEAQAVIDVAAASDPAVMDQPLAIGLRAVAATLAGRADDAAPLADTRLTGSTEIELWRALLHVAQDEVTAQDAISLAKGLPLLSEYPAAMRDRLLPGALEALILHGQAEAARPFIMALRDVQSLDLARAMAREQDNQTDDALKTYDQVASRGDRLARYKAMVRAAEMRIKSGQFDAKAGADALDRALMGWREPKQEVALRLRIAELRAQAKQWREALTVLRDGREIFPQERAPLDQKMSAIFIGLLNDEAARHLPPAEFVSLYDQNVEMVRTIDWTEKDGTDLVDRLVGLNLQGRAEPIMARLVNRATSPVRRAMLGARLAALRMTLEDPAGAIAALASTAPPANAAVDPRTMRLRQMQYAQAEYQRGKSDAALTVLRGLDSADADEMRAEIYAASKDWSHVVGALTALERRQAMTATLTEPQQALIMRLAVAATLSADSATLARLADSYGAAMAKGSSASLFRLMTSPPAKGTADLPRAFQDIQLAKQLEGRISPASSP